MSITTHTTAREKAALAAGLAARRQAAPGAAAGTADEPLHIRTVKLWGIPWTCSFDGGRLVHVIIDGCILDARNALRDSVCDAIERAYAEATA